MPYGISIAHKSYISNNIAANYTAMHMCSHTIHVYMFTIKFLPVNLHLATGERFGNLPDPLPGESNTLSALEFL
jgi:hypothetical protein